MSSVAVEIHLRKDGLQWKDLRWETMKMQRAFLPVLFLTSLSLVASAQQQAASLWQKTHLVPDLALAKDNGQIYLPVIFPGFCLHSLNPSSPANQITRKNGASCGSRRLLHIMLVQSQ